jgi:hypothetical protein
MNNKHRTRYHGRYFVTGDYTAIKLLISSVIFSWVILNLNWAKLIPQIYAEPEFADPRSDIKVVEVEKIKYVIPQTIQEEICSVFGKDCPEALRIFTCESGLRPSAKGTNTNGSTDVGIAQINSIHSIPEAYLKNPHINILVAKQMFDSQGWGPWVCARKLGII